MEVSDLQSAQMMVDCQRVQPSSKNSTGGLTSQSDSSKGGKKNKFWFVCTVWPTFTSKFTSTLTAFKKFNLQQLDCLETMDLSCFPIQDFSVTTRAL